MSYVDNQRFIAHAATCDAKLWQQTIADQAKLQILCICATSHLGATCHDIKARLNASYPSLLLQEAQQYALNNLRKLVTDLYYTRLLYRVVPYLEYSGRKRTYTSKPLPKIEKEGRVYVPTVSTPRIQPISNTSCTGSPSYSPFTAYPSFPITLATLQNP